MHFVFVYGITYKTVRYLTGYYLCMMCCKYFLIKSRCRGKSCEWGMTPSITTQRPAASLMIATSLWPHIYHLSRIPHPTAIVYLISTLHSDHLWISDTRHQLSGEAPGEWGAWLVPTTTTTTTPGHSVQLRSHASPHHCHWHTVLHLVGELGQ